jgi:hypothetical protein
MKLLIMMGAVLALGATRPAAAAEPVEVMVLGTYHFDNPGRDLNNMKADDVTRPRRQAELQALAEALASYKPTKVMIESLSKSADLIDRRFAAFTPEALTKDRNEITQIGYRLAHRLKLGKVYAIDEQSGPGEPNYFPFDKLAAFAKANGKMGPIESLMAEGAAATKKSEENQKTLSIAEMLVEANRPDGRQSTIGPYYSVLGIGDTEQQPGAELNAMWYLRNAKIFAKLMTVAEPGDRILVIYGSGHNYWLRHFASETPGFKSVDPLPYLKQAAGK